MRIMKFLRKLTGLFGILLLTGCSNLFETIYNEDGTEKTGDASLSAADENTDTTSGLVVIKASAPTVNQITYNESQHTYYVGEVPSCYSDDWFDDTGYKNGTSVKFLAKDDPAEFRCYKNDGNATVTWKAEQTWRYIPEVKTNRTTDSDGNEVTYNSIISETAEKLAKSENVHVVPLSKGDWSRVHADIPYGVTVLTCTITADDSQYTSVYRIIVTKSFVKTSADSDSQSENLNTVTDHGLVVIKATQPGINAINYSSTTYEYEVGDPTGADKSNDLIGRDDPVIFKCFLLDENSTLTWKAKQTKKYTLTYDEQTGGITGQELQDLEEDIIFDWTSYGETHTGTTPYLEQTEADSITTIKSNLPYGVTEVYALITAENINIDGERVTDTAQYKITLTKRYIITSATSQSADGMTGLGVYANGTVNGKQSGTNLITYSAGKRNYSVTGFNGGTDPVMVTFKPEEPEHTELIWTARQTQTYKAETSTYSATVNGETVTYTYQTGGNYQDCDEVDLIADGTMVISCPVDGQGIEICSGDLPYGTTVVTVTAVSTADPESSANANTYTVTLKKKHITTSTNIISDDNSNISLVTDSGLVVISAQEPNVNQISFRADTLNYSVDGITGLDNDMGFRCFLADSEATITWNITQTKTFTAQTTTSEKTVTDSVLETTTKVTTTTVTGQTVKDCSNEIEYTVDDSYTDNQAITAEIPYGVTVVTATLSAPGEEETSYTITLTRNIYTGSSSSSSDTYSLLSDLEISISDGESNSSTGTLTPEFSSTTYSYTLEVDENADSITIDATAAYEDAEIEFSDAVTKYGTVPGAEGNTVQLAGGTSRITLTVTDETGIPRTYTIYVVKPNDGDTSLKSLSHTPSTSFSNGVEGFSTDTSYIGESAAGTAKYEMTLSADSRKDVTAVSFTAVPNDSRTTVAYGYSSDIATLPTEWTENYTYATQNGTSAKSYTVQTGDENSENVTRILWVKTISGEYYHTDESSSSGYASTKTRDTTYHAVKITKAGDANTNLTALEVIATYEDGTTKTILTQTSNDTVAWKTAGESTNVTTYADKLDFYFRPLDKDTAATYTAKNTKYDGSDENTTFTGYASSAKSLTKETGDYFNDGASEYYHFAIGEIAQGTGADSQTKDLPNGTTAVTICGVTYDFVKPNLNDTSYSVSGWDGTGGGVDNTSRTSYIYVENSVQSVVLSLNVTQQNATVTVDSVTQTAGANESAVTESTSASYSVLHKDASSTGIVSNAWKVCIGNASYAYDGYTRTEPETESSENTILPVGTTKVVLYVLNNGTKKDYTYYIVRADDSESRLKTLTVTNGKTTVAPIGFDWTSSSESDTYVLKSDAYTIDAGVLTLTAKSVSENATISVTKSRSEKSTLASVDGASDWEEAAALTNNSTSNGTFIGKYEITENDTGTLLFTVTVTSKTSTTHVCNLLVYVEADTNATLTSLKIIQNGTTSSYTNPILANSFSSDTTEYKNLSASLSYTGDIVITPTAYEKAGITGYSVKTEDESIESSVSVSDNVITIPYSYYSENLGKTITVTYTVQAQDKRYTNSYTAEIYIPSLTTITEFDTYEYSSEYSYTIPSITADSKIAYRFGSVIADESTFLGKTKSYFGGIDIIGTSDNATWYESSFAQSGFQLVVNVDGDDYWVKLDENGKSETFYTVDFTNKTITETENPGISLTVTPVFQYESETPYLGLTFSLENTSGKSVKLGASIDTLVGTVADSTKASNDSVTVANTDTGFVMNGNDYNFTVVLKNAYGVDDVDMLWYGAYDSSAFSHMSVFTDKTSSLSKGSDSAASFCWILGMNSSYNKTIRINMGE